MEDWACDPWEQCNAIVDEVGGDEDSILIRCDKPAVYVTDYGYLCEEHAPQEARKKAT